MKLNELMDFSKNLRGRIDSRKALWRNAVSEVIAYEKTPLGDTFLVKGKKKMFGFVNLKEEFSFHLSYPYGVYRIYSFKELLGYLQNPTILMKDEWDKFKSAVIIEEL